MKPLKRAGQLVTVLSQSNNVEQVKVGNLAKGFCCRRKSSYTKTNQRIIFLTENY